MVVAAAASTERRHHALMDSQTALDAAEAAFGIGWPAHLDYPPPPWNDCSGPDASMLVIITSCMRNMHLWDELRAWGKTLGASQGILIVAGTSLDTEYVLSRENSTLFVNCSDAYDALPEKLLRAYTAVVDAPELAGVTHIFNTDDTDVTDSLNTSIKKGGVTDSSPHLSEHPLIFSPYPQEISIAKMENQLRGVGERALRNQHTPTSSYSDVRAASPRNLLPQCACCCPNSPAVWSAASLPNSGPASAASLAPQLLRRSSFCRPTVPLGVPGAGGDYFTPESGLQLAACKGSPTNFDWGWWNIPNGHYWKNHTFACHDTFAYAGGGAGYIMGRRALRALSET